MPCIEVRCLTMFAPNPHSTISTVDFSALMHQLPARSPAAVGAFAMNLMCEKGEVACRSPCRNLNRSSDQSSFQFL